MHGPMNVKLFRCLTLCLCNFASSEWQADIWVMCWSDVPVPPSLPTVNSKQCIMQHLFACLTLWCSAVHWQLTNVFRQPNTNLCVLVNSGYMFRPLRQQCDVAQQQDELQEQCNVRYSIATTQMSPVLTWFRIREFCINAVWNGNI